MVTESPSRARTRAPEMSVTGAGSRLHALEVRGLADVGGLGVPLEGVALGRGQALPALVAGEDVGVVLDEHVLADGLADDPLDLGRVGPDVLQEHVGAGLVLADRVVLDVPVHRPGQRVGDDQRRGGQVVHLDVGVDPALEVAVAREDRGDREVVLLHRGRDRFGQRARVPDAGDAAVADEVEAELLEVGGEAGLVVVVGDDLRTRGQRRLDPGLDAQTALDGVLGQQRGGDHHRGVGGVGAAGDRGDRDGAVVDLGLACRPPS